MNNSLPTENNIYNETEIISNAPLGSATSMIPCCLCGTMIQSNAANQCGSCLAQQFDLKSLLEKGPGGSELTIHQCRQCRRFESSTKTNAYEHFELESPELLSVCLKRIPALQNQQSSTSTTNISHIQVMDAMWVWTEPHSMRLKIRLTVRATVGESQNLLVQQRVLITYHLKFKQCSECNREFTNRTWHVLVQVRQKSSSRKGLLVLEMAIARRPDLRNHMLRVVTVRNGFDFYFWTMAHAQAFVQFLSKMAPIKTKTTQKLVSSDVKNNTANVKTTIVCDLVPLTRHDLVLVDKRAGGKMAGRVCLVPKLSKSIRLLDVAPSRRAKGDIFFDDVYSDSFWKNEKYYKVYCSQNKLVPFVILDMEPCSDAQNDTYALVDVELVRESDFGKNDVILHCISHLGKFLQVGDTVLGYDITSMVLAPTEDYDIVLNPNVIVPDVVLVKKAKGTGVTGEEKPADNPKEKQPRAKSSSSKRKEKRLAKLIKKEKELEETAARMGFLQDDQEAALALEKAAFEKELEEDAEWKHEIEEYLETAVDEKDDLVQKNLLHDLAIAEKALEDGSMDHDAKNSS